MFSARLDGNIVYGIKWFKWKYSQGKAVSWSVLITEKILSKWRLGRGSVDDNFSFIHVVGVISVCKVSISLLCYLLAIVIFFCDNPVARVHIFSLLLISIMRNTPVRSISGENAKEISFDVPAMC